MRLAPEQIASFVRGCHGLEEIDGALFFDRIGAAGRAYYDLNPAWHLRSRCPAGVVIEMRTDAAAVDIRLRLGGGARPYAAVDALVEGALVATILSQHSQGDMHGRLVLPANERSRRLKIYLPHSAVATLVSIDLIDATSVEQVQAAKLLLTLGDSITQGMDAIHPSLTYAAVAARQMHMDLHNYGVGGAVFAKASFPVAPIIAKPHLISIAYGTNDFNEGRSLEMARDYLSHVRAIFPDTPMVVLIPLWRTRGDQDGWCNPNGISLASYRDSLRSIVEDVGLPMIEHEWLLPADASMLIDGLHPNDAGHLILGMNLADRLGRLLEAHAHSSLSPLSAVR